METEEKGVFIHLEDYIKKWAVFMFKLSATNEDKKLKPEQISYDIKWDRVEIDHKKTEYDKKDDAFQTPKNHNLFSTTFENSTNLPQEYSLHAERTTRSVCEIERSRGYTFGFETELKLSIPGGIFEASVGFSSEIAVSGTKRQTKEEELTWGINSQVHVPAKHRAFAVLEITEKELKSDFSIMTKLSGRIYVNTYNLKDNNSFIKYIDGDIVNVLRKEMKLSGDGPGKTGISKDVYIQDNVLHLITRGTCLFRFASEQTINLRQEPLKS